MTEVVADSFLEQWEKRVGIKHTDPNFRTFVEDELTNKSAEEAKSVLQRLGLVETPPVPTPRIPFDGKSIPNWLKSELRREGEIVED